MRTLCQILGKVSRTLCPLCHRLLYAPAHEYTCVKVVLGFLYGLTLGTVLYHLVLVDMGFPQLQCVVVGVLLCVALAVACAVSLQVRCVSLLTIPAFAGKAGRTALRAGVLALVVSGPLQCVGGNLREVVRVFACTTELTYNMTRVHWDLMVRPVQAGLLAMRGDVSEVTQSLRSVRDVMRPLEEELEGEEELRRSAEVNDYLDDLWGDTRRSQEMKKKYADKTNDTAGRRYENKYRIKLQERCEEVLTRGSERCHGYFSNAYDRCQEKVTWLASWLLCWPMKLTFVCNLAQVMGGGRTCDSTRGLDQGIGEGYAALKDTRAALRTGLKGARVQYRLGRAPLQLDVQQASDTAQAVAHEFKARRGLMQHLLTVAKRIMSFMFIGIVLRAQQYHEQYLEDVSHDNVYVSTYFRRIDGRRRRRGQLTLLPLRKVERSEVIDPYSLCPAPAERRGLGTDSLQLLLEMATTLVFLLLDYLFSQLLALIGRHSRIDYTQTGSHDLMLKVKGTGMVASIVRSLLKGFNVRKRVKMTHSNEECVPRPHMLAHYYYYKLAGAYLLMWLLLLTAAYTHRMYRAVCAYFYPKREKRRVLYLYNEMLKRRMGLTRFLKAKVKRKVREQHHIEMEANTLMVMRLRYPSLCSWLRVLPLARRKCLICGETEPRSRDRSFKYFHECANPCCYFIYCNVCWWEIDRVCYACSLDLSDDSDYDDDHNVI